LGYVRDASQQRAVLLLEDLRARLAASTQANRWQGWLPARRAARQHERGLYLWGGVGRGKTWLMDLFFNSVGIKDKTRNHFYRFMQGVHTELGKHRDRADPLDLVAEKIARKTRLLCFDELFVTDIADAMLLGNLFRSLFDRGVTLVVTSNVPPDGLYKEGLQRARFLPAIRLLQENTEVFHLSGETDFRMRLLERAHTWFAASAQMNTGELQTLFAAMAGVAGESNASLTINHRRVIAHRHTSGVVWFNFKELCCGPRGQADYIEIARSYHTVFLSDVPLLTQDLENEARRFITLIDEFYDRNVKLVISAHATATELYRGTRLVFEFERTKSRLIEMQSQDYLSRAHR
jgi:cell division protein ZapE